MVGGRAKLPVLAEISGPAPGEDRFWSLRRVDFERLSVVRERLETRRIVLVTGEPDSVRVLAVALAGAAAASGRRTALLECDLARPRLAADLGLAQSPGLHEYLRWEATPAEILQPLALAGPVAAAAAEPLICVSAGRQAADPATLLGLKSFRHMTAKLGSAYDLLVLAGPALDAQAPLETVAGAADCVLAGLGPERTSKRDLRALRAQIGRLRVPALGAVVVAG